MSPIKKVQDDILAFQTSRFYISNLKKRITPILTLVFLNYSSLGMPYKLHNEIVISVIPVWVCWKNQLHRM